ncbi:hypothetical protein A4U88_1998 [Serratia marcescens]|nr:hypothetical protein A4U88_1998 [Serratia marcescens]
MLALLTVSSVVFFTIMMFLHSIKNMSMEKWPIVIAAQG